MWPGVVAENCESTAYYRARYYNSLTGRFLSRDPEAGDPDNPATLHKYLYAGGDPANRIDPSGRDDSIEVSLFGRVYSVAIHAAHHYWEVPLVGKLWCIHIQILTYIIGVSGSDWRYQIPLPWCSAAGPF